MNAVCVVWCGVVWYGATEGVHTLGLYVLNYVHNLYSLILYMYIYTVHSYIHNLYSAEWKVTLLP